jgi:hypothetical protein
MKKPRVKNLVTLSLKLLNAYEKGVNRIDYYFINKSYRVERLTVLCPPLRMCYILALCVQAHCLHESTVSTVESGIGLKINGIVPTTNCGVSIVRNNSHLCKEAQSLHGL